MKWKGGQKKFSLIQQKLKHGKREGHMMESEERGKCVQLNLKKVDYGITTVYQPRST